jgi:phosphomannomutase
MAHTDLIISVSGIRGIVGEGLTAEAALAFAAALGTHVQGGRVVLSRDGRPSGKMLRHAVVAGLLGTGCEVLDADILPTPTCGLAIRRSEAAGGIQITASHNPAPWNGLKLFGPEGAVLTATEGQKVKSLFETGPFRHVSWDRLGTVIPCGQAEDWHRDRVRELVDVPRIQQRQFRILLDVNGGAGKTLGMLLLTTLGCRLVPVGFETGVFEHPPEPLEENLREIAPLVPEEDADVGFVLDPDADRLALIDETGRYIGEELTLALAVLCRLRSERGPIVINMSTSRLVEDLAKPHGVPVLRSAVGEANVVEKMRQVGALIGGEGNGGVIDPRVGWVRDPFIGMALILNLLAESGQKLSELVAGLPVYHIRKEKAQADPARLPDTFAALTQRWPDARVDRTDGLRLDWPDRWLHVRPSNTEPIVRIIAEAPRADDARRLCDEATEVIATRSGRAQEFQSA